MGMRIGVLKEASDRERRVALTPNGVDRLSQRIGAETATIEIEAGAGLQAGFSDDDYRRAGAAIVDRATAIGPSGIVVQVNGPEPDHLQAPEWAGLGADHILIGLHDPLWRPERARALAEAGTTSISLELIPRITRAQSMDVLSSAATVAGYEAVLLAASRAPRMLPMLMTAAGTVPAAKFLVLGAGVAGLQAIATARRLGAIVSGYDVRPAASEQIESLGARAIDLDLSGASGDGQSSEGAGGYARRQTEDEATRQLELLAPHVAEADAVITTAAVPGASSPELITTEMVEAMAEGSVIVDLAAERGGNTGLTQADAEVVHNGVLILGPTDLASRAPSTSSQMFSTNVATLLDHLVTDGHLVLDQADEITAGTVLTEGGEVVHPAVRERLGLDPLTAADTEPTTTTEAEDS